MQAMKNLRQRVQREIPQLRQKTKQTATIHFFGEADECTIQNYGEKGVSLNELLKMHLPVPQGFTITMGAVESMFGGTSNGGQQQAVEKKKRFADRYKSAIQELEKRTGRKFGGGKADESEGRGEAAEFKGEEKFEIPLLVSVRSSSFIDAPGATASILNVGMTDTLVAKLLQTSTNPRWVYDTYRSLLQMFGQVVYGVDERKYRMIIRNAMIRAGALTESMLSIADILQIITEFKRLAVVPDDPWEQLRLAMQGVYKHWYSDSIDKLKQSYGIEEGAGVALIVQSMVFGNLDNRCGVGYAFSRNPNSGQHEFVAEYVPCAVGEDLLAGSMTVASMSNIRDERPGLYYQLQHTLKLLERHYKDLQEVEFTVQDGIFYVLHCTSARRSAKAAVSIAVKMVQNKIITEQEAITRIDPMSMMHYLRPQLVASFQNPVDEDIVCKILTRGMAASFGTAYGKVVFSNQDAIFCKEKGIPCILCLPIVSMDDVEGIEAADGVLTSRGGFASYAGIWLRENGKPGVFAARDLAIDVSSGHLIALDTGLRATEGDYITIDGSTGYVFIGEAPTTHIKADDDYYTVMSWAKTYRVQNILGSVEDAQDALKAIQYGADGIGVVKTEALFYGPDTIDLTRFILLTTSESERASAISKLQEQQTSDLLTIFRNVADRDVVIRLLNISTSDCLRSLKTQASHDSLMTLADRLGMTPVDLLRKVDSMIEPNPSLGTRGCSFAITQPQFAILQSRAIAAATIAARQTGSTVRTKIQLPTAFTETEIERVYPLIKEAIGEVCAQRATGADFKDIGLEIEIGVTIATPRACMISDAIAKIEKIGFVTFDLGLLTELVFGLDQENQQAVTKYYVDRHILSRNPYTSIDERAVGSLIKNAIHNARAVRDEIKVNVYGIQASDLQSIRYFDQIGVDTLTVAKNEWIPVAAMASAQANVAPYMVRFSRPFKPFSYMT